jgi:hypothetical protein
MQKSREANREDATGAIKSWMHLNEEPEKAGFQTLRTEKREALRTSRRNLFSRLGGVEAMYAALALLTREGSVLMEQDRGSGGRRRSGGTWIEESLTWARDRGWLLQGTKTLENLKQKAMQEQVKMRAQWTPREGTGQHKVLDVRAGWGSIGIAVSQMQEGCSTVGLDRALDTEGFLELIQLHGQVTSRLKLDLCSVGSQNVLRRASKLAMRQLGAFAMVWLSPECRILTSANTLNVSRGCTNGKLLFDPRNSMDS